MKAFEIIMTLILAACVVYVIWCMHGASKYLREHPKEFNKPISRQSDGNNKQ